MRVNAEGWLIRDRADDPPILHMTTERTCRQLGPKGEPLGLVNHYTAVEGTLKNMIAMCGRTAKMAPPLTPAQVAAGMKRRNPSWNLLACMDGTLIQCAPFTRGTFAVVGKGTVLGYAGTINALTIQLEVENAGQVYQVNGKFYQGPIYKKGTKIVDPKNLIPTSRVFGSKGLKWWTMFTAEQQLTIAYLYAALMIRFGWTAKQLTLTHRQFNAPRKMDPGEAYTLMLVPQALAHAQLLSLLWQTTPPIDLPMPKKVT